MRLFILMLSFLLANTFSVYGGNPAKEIKLNQPDLTRGKLLMQVLKERRTQRSFSTRELSLDMLSNLLWAGSGVNRPDGKMTAPTAVNWKQIEIYAAMKDGVYFYNAQKNVLELFLAKDIRADVGVQDFTADAPVCLIYVANHKKMTGPAASSEKSRNFYAATDTGFVSQNVYLFCASENLATVVLGWVEKEKLEKILGFDESKKVILTQPVGYPK